MKEGKNEYEMKEEMDDKLSEENLGSFHHQKRCQKTSHTTGSKVTDPGTEGRKDEGNKEGKRSSM